MDLSINYLIAAFAIAATLPLAAGIRWWHMNFRVKPAHAETESLTASYRATNS